MLDATMVIAPSDSVFTAVEIAFKNHSTLKIDLPNPKTQQFWSKLLHRDPDCLITISAQETTLDIRDQRKSVVLATVTVADTDTGARLGSWLVVSNPCNRSMWLNDYFDPSLSQRDIAAILSSLPQAMEQASA